MYVSLECELQTADIANANATEEDKLIALINQSGEGFDPSQYVIRVCMCIHVHAYMMVLQSIVATEVL